jgi:hypothetical protein
MGIPENAYCCAAARQAGIVTRKWVQIIKHAQN